MKSHFLTITPLFLIAILTATNARAQYYDVLQGDTLGDIAESNYHERMKWRELYDLNRESISNPNLIYPGQRIRLLGDVEEAPRTDHYHGHSEEWRLLPLQSWEKFVFKMPPQIDPDGFDRRSKIYNRVAEKSTATLTIASDRIAILGEITNARSEYERLFLGDQVFVRADETLQVGSIYSITTGPQKIVSKRDGRVGFGYDLTGRIKLVGVRDGLFIGTIISLYYPVRRGQLLIPEVPDYYFPTAIPSANPINATIVIPVGAREDMLGEEKIVYIDAGTQDGVKPGMIFRNYLHTDPYLDEPITAKDFLIEAELQVLSTQDKFSVAIIISGRNNVKFGDELVALTDLQDFQKNQGIQTLLQDNAKPSAGVNDLDKMDPNDGIGEKENHELRQLEKWAHPAPEASAPGIDDEIRRVDTHDHPRQSFDIGSEPAPNDGSAKPAAPEAAPAPAPAPAPDTSTPPVTAPPATVPPPPEAQPAPQTSAPPLPDPNVSPVTGTDPQPDAPATQIQGSAPAPANPAPVTDKPADPFATPAP